MTKTVLVTGAGSGIGLSCVEKFLDEGWNVIAHYHKSLVELNKLEKKVGSKRLTIVRSDFKRGADVTKFLNRIEKVMLHALVNNAAEYDLSLRSKTRIKSIQDVLQVNVVVPVLIAETVLKVMKSKNNGAIVNVSSIGVKYGSSINNLFYGVSKGGLEIATKSFAREGAPHNVLVNAIRPGVTDTPFHKKISKDLNKRKKMIPLKRVAKPSEIAKEIYHLCAENTFMTGEVVTIAGGE